MTIRNKNRGTKGKSSFLKVYLIVFSSILAIILLALAVLWFAMADMEKSNPETLLKPVINDFADRDYDSLFKLINVKDSEFESCDTFKNYIKNSNSSGMVTYIRKVVQDDKAYVVVIKSDDKKIATVTLRKSDKKSFFGNELYTLESITPIMDKTSAYYITAPSDAKISVNGKELSSKYIDKKDIPIDELKNLPDTVEKKTLVKYKIEGLVNEPVVTAKGHLGNDLKITKNDKDKQTSFECGYDAPEDNGKQYDKLITNVAHQVAMRTTNDTTFTEVAKYFYKDSVTYEMLRRNESSWYTPHDKYEFKNTQIMDYKEYSDNCFSYRIKFDHYVYRIEAKVTRNRTCDYTFVFVKTDGKWLVYDMIMNAE